MEVWYKLDKHKPDVVELGEGSKRRIVDLRDAIKKKWGDDIQCAAPRLTVFPAGAGADPNTGTSEPLGPGDTVPSDTTVEKPLIVVTPVPTGGPSQKVETLVTEPPQKRPKPEAKDFSLKHLQSIARDDSWSDCGKGLEFMGRSQFVDKVKGVLRGRLLSPPGSPEGDPLSPAEATGQPASTVQKPTPPAGLIQSQSSTGMTGPRQPNNNTSQQLLPPPEYPRPIAAIPQAKTDIKKATALVYSSVSGSGKTVSMLQLKSKLPKEMNNFPVVVAYLGFGTGLELLEEETQHILDKQNQGAGVVGAAEVLARRLAAATIISMCHRDVVTGLPRSEQVYEGYRITTVKESKDLLLNYAKKEKKLPMYIVAGVDEVQLLNQQSQVGGETKIGLGRIFLRILRYWQHIWYKEGIRLLPLGTGIAIDWTADPTTGMNEPLHGDDTTLISKEDFHELVEKVVGNLNDKKFSKRVSSGTSKETIIDLIAASYWPRVRLLEWWRDGEKAFLGQGASDSNAVQWVNWLCHWLRDEALSCIEDKAAVPGKGDEEGKIHCLFELSKNSQNFSVIPDGYASHSMIRNLMEKLPVPLLYQGLDVIKSLDPCEFILKDAYDFENLGFHAVGAAIHVGLHALKGRGITLARATPTQKMRLGLALWFQDNGAVTHQNGELCVPSIFGPVGMTGNFGDFYPFETNQQTSFMPEVVAFLQKQSVTAFKPVYIRCGRRTCCDYLYFYVRLTPTNKVEFICNIDDTKHTNTDDGQGGGESVTTADQEGLFDAVTKVRSAVNNANLVLGVVRLLFVSNRNSLANPKANSAASKGLTTAKQAAQEFFPEVELELLNKHTFEFGPFSKIMEARRKKRELK